MKVLHEKLGDRFYRKKGVVEEVRDTFTGVVKMIETGDKLKIDQAYLETVIPAIGMDSIVSDSRGRSRVVADPKDVDKLQKICCCPAIFHSC